MKERFVMKKILLGMMVFSIMFFPSHVSAHWHSGYSHNQGIEFQNSMWMDTILDDTRLSNLSIPGTHDTMSDGPGGDIARTQAKSLNEQLNLGIRFLDIRTRVTNGSLALHHGPIFLNKMFGDVLLESIDFLKKNPSEVIFMRIKQEHSSVLDTEFVNILNSYLECEPYSSYIYRGENKQNPTLGEMRGKIVVIRNFLGSSMGLDYTGQFDIQDNYHLNTNWDLYDKWGSVKNQVNKANSNYSNENKYINYLSGSGGSFPYFVASGHSSPGTSAPRLATGLTHPGWKNSYPDFPRTDWFLGIATIAFEGTNVLTTDYIRNNNIKNTGIVMADFPGQGLINNIIGLNHINSKPERVPDGIYSIHPSYLSNMSLDFTLQDRYAIIYDNHDRDNQKFEFRYDYNQQAYQIFNKNGDNIIMAWLDVGGSNQVFGHRNEFKPEHYWILEKVGNNMYVFKNKKNPNLVLDVDGRGATNETKVKMNERHPENLGSAQRFTLKVNN